MLLSPMKDCLIAMSVDGASSDDDSSVFDEDNTSSLEFPHRGSDASSTPSIPSRDSAPASHLHRDHMQVGVGPQIPAPAGGPHPGHRSSHHPPQSHHHDHHQQQSELKTQGVYTDQEIRGIRGILTLY